MITFWCAIALCSIQFTAGVITTVDLELVCSSRPKFKGKPWEIYEHLDCDNNKTGMADIVEIIAGINLS